MNYWKMSLILLILVFLAGSFYWFQYLPYKVKRDCSDGLVAFSARENKVSLYDKYFDMCINSGSYEKFKGIINENIPKDSEPEPQEVQIITTPNSSN